MEEKQENMKEMKESSFPSHIEFEVKCIWKNDSELRLLLMPLSLVLTLSSTSSLHLPRIFFQ